MDSHAESLDEDSPVPKFTTNSKGKNFLIVYGFYLVITVALPQKDSCFTSIATFS